MAIIDCPECGNKVSDKAENCPHCGFPIQQQETTVNSFPIMPQPKRNRNWIWISVVGIFVIAIIGIVYWYLIENNDSINDKKEVQITPEFIQKVHQYDELYPYSDGLAAVRKNGKYGFIDINGDLVVPCEWYRPTGKRVYGYVDLMGNKTITESDIAAFETYKREQIAKKQRKNTKPS